MRVSTNYQWSSYTKSIADAQARYVTAQNQLSSGKRITQPSDDPVGTASIVSMNSLKSAAERYQKNLQHGASFMKFTESAFGEAGTLLNRAYEFAVRGANAATDQQGREAMVRELTTIQNRLVEIANTRGPQNQYIFAGQETETQPITGFPGNYTYNGDANPLTVESGPNETMTINSNASNLFLDALNRIESLKNNLVSGNTGAISGIDIAAIQTSQRELSLERGIVGSKLVQANSLISDFERRQDEFTEAISNIEEVDMAEAMVQYRLSETAYQAALNVASQGFRLSLLDFVQG